MIQNVPTGMTRRSVVGGLAFTAVIAGATVTEEFDEVAAEPDGR